MRNFSTTASFGAMIRARKEAEAAEAAPVQEVKVDTAEASKPVRSTRPAQAVKSRLVRLKRREDGTVLELHAAPPFLYQDRKAVVEKYDLPEDVFWRDSPEHLARKAEMEQGAE